MRYKISWKLWLACSSVVYLLFMTVMPAEGKLEGYPIGVFWLMLIEAPRHPDTLPFLAMFNAFWGTISIVLGWVAQAIGVVALSRWSNRTTPQVMN